MKNKLYFPMFVDLSDKNIVVVGGGNVATRRVRTLLKFTRNIKVVAPQMTAELMELGKAAQIQTELRPVKRTDFERAYMVLTATNDGKLNDDIYRICKAEGIYVNVSSDKEKCDFYFPGIFIQDEIVVGITASGLDHEKAKQVRMEIQKVLDATAGEQKDED